MAEIAIRAQGLGKQYRIGAGPDGHLRDHLARLVTAPFRRGRERERPSTTFWALKDVSFELREGEVLGIVGRNGAGKSTLLKILSRITEPTEGCVDLTGRVASLLEVGTGFHGELTGRENVFLNGAILGMRREEILRKFDEIVAFAEVDRFIDTPVKHYSSGMYLRLAFAVAAHLEPEILIVDEVLAVGDLAFQKKCLGRMREVSHSRGRAILFVSHNMDAIEALCTRAIWLNSGQVVSDGDVRQTVERYARSALGQPQASSSQRRLSPMIDCERLEVTPKPVSVGDSLRIDLQLHAKGAPAIKELAILIYTQSGVRAAIVDCRSNDVLAGFTHGERLRLSVHVSRLNLVPGEYLLGLYINCADTVADFHDLAVLSVIQDAGNRSVAPYPAHARGVVELDFHLEVEHPEAEPAVTL